MRTKRTVSTRQWRKARKLKAGYLRWILDRYVVLGRDPAFITDCVNFDRVDFRTPIEQQSILEKLAGDFYVVWGVYPLPAWLLNDDMFKQTLGKRWKQTGKAIDITVTPTTTRRELLEKFNATKRTLKTKRQIGRAHV